MRMGTMLRNDDQRSQRSPKEDLPKMKELSSVTN